MSQEQTRGESALYFRLNQRGQFNLGVEEPRGWRTPNESRTGQEKQVGLDGFIYILKQQLDI